ncbi:MAG: lipopolysaccharide transport periplasmic protein LptA [Gammaproteobacteria bacterium]|nr:lipopolysaccharide transport periplasmic protein LptA [Gammaproteobacteria bacterium]
MIIKIKTPLKFYLLILVLITNYSYSITKNNTEPVVITADYFTIDYINGYALYSKKVHLTQATRSLSSDNIIVYFNKSNKNDSVKLITASNNTKRPVTYTEKSSKNQPIVAMADIIKFDPVANKLIFEKNAHIEQNNRTLSSQLIYYDLEKETAYMPKINQQRTKLILGSQRYPYSQISQNS